MGGFYLYGDTFLEALENIEKDLIQCQENNLALSDSKCHMSQTASIFLSILYLVSEFKSTSSVRIQVEPTEIEVI